MTILRIRTIYSEVTRYDLLEIKFKERNRCYDTEFEIAS